MSWECVRGHPPARTFEEVLACAEKARRGEQVVVEVCGMLLEGGLIDYSSRAEVPRGRLPPRSTVSAHEINTELAAMTRPRLEKITKSALHHLLVAVLAENEMRKRD